MESESEYSENDLVEDCEDIDGNLESKEGVLDLTVHCEPTLHEDEDDIEENGYEESLVLEEECVDPLEFLEVDQTLVREGAGCPNDTKDDGHISNQDSVPKDPECKNHTNNDGHLSNQDSPCGRSPSKIITCEKCGCLKNPTNNTSDSAVHDYSNLKNDGFEVFCSCAKERFVKCKVCQKIVKQLGYDSHLRGHKRKRKHGCDICGKKFLYAVHLRNHASVHVSEKTYLCDICKKSFKLFRSLKNHILSCTKKKRYRCNVCGESFPLKRSFLDHLRTHEKVPEESFNCEICCIVFDNSSSKKEHIMQVHVAAQRFVCSTCGEAFVTESAMKRHTVTHSRSYPCKFCGATFTTRRDLIIHKVQHRASKELRCRTCGTEFEQFVAYSEHRLSQCCNENRTICELCNKSFKDKTALKKHIMVHIPLSERSVRCEICERSFCGISALRKHIRLIHADSRPYTCEFCSKSFNQLCKLKYHIVIHASDKPVSCDICNKAFSNEKDIKIHMRTHTGERPFKCNICGKSFRQRGHVKTHQLVHTKEKPFNCLICNKGFGLTSSLKKHMRLHTTNVSITTA